MRLTANITSEIMKVRRQWDDIFEKLKEKDCWPRIAYSAKPTFIKKEEISTASDKNRFFFFFANRPDLMKVH